jgi:fumarylacetoacetate (FAA) hydrolase
MKLATYKDGSRDGQLVVVSRDLASAHYASGIASRLQQVLDDWNFLSPQLEDLSTTLNHGRARHAFPFEPAACMAPLPRAFQWVESGADVNDATRLQLAHGASDDFHGPRDSVACADAGAGVAAGLAVVTSDVARGTAPATALETVRFVMLASSVHLRRDADGPQGDAETRLATAFGPVAVTPDELGAAWQGGRVHLNIEAACNGKRLAAVDAGAAMVWHFGQLIARLCTARRLRAGAIVGSGALRRSEATLGDSLRTEVTGADGLSVFGSIEQRLVAPDGTRHAAPADPP